MKILKYTYIPFKLDRSFVFVFSFWVASLFMLTLLKNAIGQSNDIHSFNISLNDKEKLDFADSLLNCDYQKASKFVLDELDGSLKIDKPDIYAEFLTKAISASYLSGQISISDSLFDLLMHIKIDNMHPVFESRILLNQATAARTYRRFLLALDYSKKHF